MKKNSDHIDTDSSAPRLPSKGVPITRSKEDVKPILARFNKLFLDELIKSQKSKTYQEMVDLLSPSISSASHYSSLLSGKDNRKPSVCMLLVAYHELGIDINELFDAVWKEGQST